MRPLTARDVLEAWEAGQRQHPIDRALTLLAAASPDRSRGALADLRLGERDTRLLALYGQLFGPRLVGFTRCPECGERLELPLAVAELSRLSDGAVETPEEIAADGFELRFRPLTSRDLAAAALAPDGASARRLLAERSVIEARSGGGLVAARELPEALVERLAARLAECDPGAEILIDAECPECRHPWSTPLDVGECLWAQVRVLARRLLWEIDSLARVYHWSEPQILALSPRRRRVYLEMVA